MPHDTGTSATATASSTEAPHTTLIYCSPELDISGAQDLYDTLQAALGAQCPVVLDATHVERVDTVGLQMLCAFVRDAQASGIVVQWRQPSPALENAARLLHVQTCLALPIA
jgi:phospholipid transport system transporter-binding protein